MRVRMMFCWICILLLALIAIPACSDDDDDNPTGSSASVPAELVGTYDQTSVSVNGTAQNLADFFEWSTGTVRSTISVYGGGEQTYKEYNASDAVLYTDSGYVTLNGENITVVVLTEAGTPLAVPDTGFVGTWDLTGSLLTLTMVESSDTITIVSTKQ